MQVDIPILFVEINNSNYIFVAGKYDDDQNLNIIEKIIVPNKGINENKFINIDHTNKVVKKNIKSIEDKLNYIFKEVTIILDNFDYSCINISGFKKLNGSQVLRENISYILNSLKSVIVENEKQKTILHIFNSKSVLDGAVFENLPLGLFGDFYSHELTFLLIKNNDLKNIKQIFYQNNLSVKKVLIKDFIEGVQLVNQNDNVETFFKVKINKDSSHVSFFDKASFRYAEYFNFGTKIIFKDIAKVCSIDQEMIDRIFSDESYRNRNFKDNELIEEKYFIKEHYRKIRKKLILDIANARIDEIADVMLNKNINMNFFKKDNIKIYITIEDKLILDNFKENFKLYFSKNYNFMPHLTNDFEIDSHTSGPFMLAFIAILLIFS